MGTPLFPSCDPSRFPLKHIGTQVGGAANYRDSQDELLYYEILRSKQVAHFGRISTKSLVMCRSGMALWRPKMRADRFPTASVIYVWRGTRRKRCLSAPTAQQVLCPAHILHVTGLATSSPWEGGVMVPSHGGAVTHPGTWPVSCPGCPQTLPRLLA